MKSKLLRISFWTTSIVFLIILLVSVFVSLQIKFALFGQFFANFLNLIHFLTLTGSLVDNHYNKYFYILFISCYSLKNIWILLSIFSFNILMVIMLIKSSYKIKKIIILILAIVSSILFLFNNDFIHLAISYACIIYIIFILLNYIFSKNNIIVKILLRIPLINIIIPSHLFDNLKDKDICNRIIYILINSLVIFSFSFTISLLCITRETYFRFFSLGNDTYNIEYSSKLKSILVSIPNKNYMLFINTETLKNEHVDIQDISDTKEVIYQYIKYNELKDEIYLYNSKCYEFYVFDSIDYKLKNKIKLKEIDTVERIDFDNDSQTICLALDRGYAYIFDMNTLEIKRYIEIPCNNDGVVFNKVDKSYVLSFWTDVREIVVIPVDSTKEVRNIVCPNYQGYILYSNRNKELYISFHQQGRVGVYDAQTYKLKRVIHSQYSVRDIWYDEENNLLFAPGFFNGYLDVFLMDGTDSLVYRKYCGLFLRGPYFSKEYKRIFIPTNLGLKRFDLEEKDILLNIKND